MTPPAEEPTLAELSWHLRTLETTVAKMETRSTESFAALGQQIASLSFVRNDVYAADQRSLDNSLRVLSERIDATDRRAMWAFALVGTVTIGAIITAILSTAGVFQ